jgi:hypothetical protein
MSWADLTSGTGGHELGRSRHWDGYPGSAGFGMRLRPPTRISQWPLARSPRRAVFPISAIAMLGVIRGSSYISADVLYGDSNGMTTPGLQVKESVEVPRDEADQPRSR